MLRTGDGSVTVGQIVVATGNSCRQVHRIGKFVVITGATRGLGRAMAEQFVAQGHTVAGCGRSAQQIRELRKQFGPPHSFREVDVADDAAVKAWAQEILKSHTPPDLLLNNAGIINRNAPLWEVPAAEFSQVIDVNIKGVANVIRHFAPAMIG
ncbi:MAG: SDR family NAD(P)-dependent oxidoreductase, partial [Verrucomicrobia subdivision 3 bacterium]|nr:SDR family NAD(P)-dependent oxidoreductase [Limisphaerales bacterium]